ncbi:MAG: hypothetical protein DRP25_04810 [Thermotoga sp.]|nr:MAG: hypothetical protein DRP25_04810 [Thermotoga sp.]
MGDEQIPTSNVDISVGLEKPIEFKFLELWDKFEEILNVDILTVKMEKAMLDPTLPIPTIPTFMISLQLGLSY